MKLSVLICTRNRAKSLEATLRRFFAQRFSGDYQYEVVIVNNNSTDETQRVVEGFATEHPGRVRHVLESRRGHTYARNTSVAAASGEILVFTDDDVLVDENWLNEIYREFASDPSLYLLGGRVLLARDGLQGVTVQPSNERQTFVFPNDGNFVIGANMAIRHEVFGKVGLFDVRLGAGRFLAGGDEVELFYRALKSGYRLLYAPNVLVFHDHGRVSLEQACRLEYGYGKGFSAYLLKHALRGDTHAMKMVYWNVYKIPRWWLRKNGEPPDILRRRRANIRGFIVGLIAGPLFMWRRGTEQPG